MVHRIDVRVRIAATALLSLALVACGGSGGSSTSSNDRPVGDDPGTGDTANVSQPVERDRRVAGSVRDAITDVPLVGAQVTLIGEDGERFTTETDATGNYAFDNVAADASDDLTLSAEGYLGETFARVPSRDGATQQLEQVRLVPQDSAGDGGLSGTVLDATDGSPLAGVELRFRRGINNRDGEVVAEGLTDAEGDWSVSGLGYGNLTYELDAEGFNTAYVTVFVLGGIERADQNASLSPFVEGGALRIIMSWGAVPDDLDSHLTGPALVAGDPAFHVFFFNTRAADVELDIDDISRFGPETITLGAVRQGHYRYSVDNFSNNSPTELGNSDARVQVVDASGTLAEFNVPSGVGNVWRVFDIVDGEIVPINRLIERDFGDDVFFVADDG